MSRESRRTRLVITFLLLTSLTLLLIDGRRGDSPLRPVRDGIGALAGPVQRAVGAAVAPPVRIVRSLGDLATSRDEIAKLRDENARLRQQEALTQSERHRLDELESLTKLSTLRRYPVKPARVIALSAAQGFASTATIDAGTNDGIRVDTTVVGPGADGQGLVGRVVAVQRSTATVLLADDPACYVGVRRSGSGGISGGVTGTGSGRALELTAYGAHPVTKGEVLVTAGSANDAPYVKDVVVGTVTTVRTAAGTLTTRAEVQPAVDLSALDVVGVVLPPVKTPARRSVPEAAS